MNDIHPTRGRRIAGAGPATPLDGRKDYAYRAGLTPQRRAELDKLRTELDAQARKPWDEDQDATPPPAARPRRPSAAAAPAVVAEESRATVEPPAREEPAPAPAPEPEPAPEPVTPPAAHCRKCGYLTTAIGHRISCEVP